MVSFSGLPKITDKSCPEGATLEARNRTFHRMLANGVTVEYRTGDGNIRGDQVQIVDFDNPANTGPTGPTGPAVGGSLGAATR